VAKRVVPDIDDLRAAIEERIPQRLPRLERYNSPTRVQARSYARAETQKGKRRWKGGLPVGPILGPRLDVEENPENWPKKPGKKYDGNVGLSVAIANEDTREWGLVERLLLEALEKRTLSDTQLADVYESLGFRLSIPPDQKRLQLVVRHTIKEFFFTEFLSFQPNASVSVNGKSLEQELPKILLILTRALFGRNSTKPHRRHKGLQAYAFFEGEQHDHVHLLVWSIYEVPIDEMQRVAEKVFARFFPKGTVDVAPIKGQEQRRKAVSYATKEIWKGERFQQFTAFGPHPSIPTLSIPRLSETAKQRRERVCRNPPDVLPDLKNADVAELKGVLQELAAAGNWEGPDPRSMSSHDLREAVRQAQVEQQRENTERAKKRRRAKYKRRAKERFSPFAVRLTPDLDPLFETDLGSLPYHVGFIRTNAIRGPPRTIYGVSPCYKIF